MPLQCPTLNGIGITHIIIPFGINPLKIAVFRAVRLYMPLSLLWLLTRRYNKALWMSLWVSKRFELCHILFSWNTAAFYPVRKKKKACCRSDFKPLWMFPLSSLNDTAVFFSGEITFLKVIDLHSNPILYDIMTYKISACNPSKYCKNYSSRSQFELWKFLQKLFFLFLLCGCQQVCSPCKLVVDVC